MLTFGSNIPLRSALLQKQKIEYTFKPAYRLNRDKVKDLRTTHVAMVYCSFGKAPGAASSDSKLR